MIHADPDAVIAAARAWLGTPYHDQASLRGIGCDCLGLARGVWRDLVGAEPQPIPPYGGRERSGCGSRGFGMRLEKGPGDRFSDRTRAAHIRDQADFDAHVRYCWGNPVKHGFVQKAVDWQYSSIHRDIRLGRVEAGMVGRCANG